MATPVADIVGLLTDNIDLFSKFDLKEEHIYPYMLDPDDDTQEYPIVVVSELPRRGHTYGNGMPIYERRRVQITFYYPRDYSGDMEGLESKIQSFLVSKDYYCYSNAGHVMTPDTRDITNTLKFNYIKEII